MSNSTEGKFHYKACGLSNVWLTGGVRIESTSGEEVFHIEQVKDLHKAIGAYLVEKESILAPDEFRFLRTEMHLSRRSLAEILGLSAETIKKWEFGENSIQKTADAWLRVLYMGHSIEGEMTGLIKKINHAEKQQLSYCLSKTTQGWSRSKCA